VRSGVPISYLKTNSNPREIPLMPLSDIIVFYPKNRKPDIEVEREIFKNILLLRRVRRWELW
jgi:hypothetical protein